MKKNDEVEKNLGEEELALKKERLRSFFQGISLEDFIRQLEEDVRSAENNLSASSNQKTKLKKTDAWHGLKSINSCKPTIRITEETAYLNSPLKEGENAHLKLLRLLEPYKKEKNFNVIFESLHAKNYSQALCYACSKQDKTVIELIKVLLPFKDKLPININEQPLPKKLGAIHHAAQNSKDAYDLLVMHGADPNLKDDTGKTAKDYYDKNFSEQKILELQ